ncbi:TPA: hypothetical protein ACGE0Z_002290 [Klebsiella pneumoniae]
MSNKLKVNDVPSAMVLFICRQMHQGPMTPRQHNKGERSLGFTKKAKQMIKLGYKPKYPRYESSYSWMD